MKTSVSDKIFVYVRVKPYVYKFFMKKFHNNFFNAVKLPNNDPIYMLIASRLVKPRNWRADKIDESRMKTAKLPIEIQDCDVRLCGFELSLNDERNVASMLEDRVHKDMLLWVSMRYLMGCPLQATIDVWMEENDLTDEDWASDTIRRMCTRSGMAEAKREYIDFVSNKISQIVGRIVTR